MRILALVLAALAVVAMLVAHLGGCSDRGGEDASGELDSLTQDRGSDSDDGAAPPGCAADVAWSLHEAIASIVVVTWTQTAMATSWVDVLGDDGSWTATPAVLRDVGQAEQPVLGVPFERDVTLRVVCDAGGGAELGDEISATTGAAPSSLSSATILAHDEEAVEPTGRYLLTSINSVAGDWIGGDFYVVIVDRQGRLVWALPVPDQHWSLATQPSTDGETILVDELSFWSDWDDGAGSLVHRMTLDGTAVETVAIPGAHHDVAELHDGTLLWGAAAGLLSETLQRRMPDGSRDTVWDCATYEDPDHAGAACQSNTVTWDPTTDSALVSIHTTSTVLVIDLSSGELLREFGHSAASWDFDPGDAAFHMQHGPRITDAGTLLTSTWSTEAGAEIVVREYLLDEATGVARQIGSAGVGDGLQAANGGDVARLPAGNTLHSCGSAGRIREYAPDGAIAWEIAWDDGQLVGRATWLEDLYAFLPSTQAAQRAQEPSVH